ncbi:MAG: hypothetical protein ACT4ON_13165 [Bacteroidota bacterium]
MLQKQLQEKIAFLKKAYEVACKHSPSSPLSVNIMPIELGASIGLDRATVTRIMTELVAGWICTFRIGNENTFDKKRRT